MPSRRCRSSACSRPSAGPDIILSDDAQRTLFHPFDTGDLDVPGKGARALFIGAEPGFRLPDGFEANLMLVQGFRLDFMKLGAGRHRVVPEVEGNGYDIALVLVGKHAGLNERRLAEAILRVKPGGVVVAGGSKAHGAASLRKTLARVADPVARSAEASAAVEGDPSTRRRDQHPWSGEVPLSGSLSKYHGIVFWLERSAEAERFARTVIEWQSGWPLIDGRFHTAPGMFSHERVDAGSKLLVQHLPLDLSGAVADFCAGWGYLAAEALDRCAGIASLDLFEADHPSLEAARANLADARVPVGFHWTDLAAEPVPRKFDAVLMNPPFHQGRAADPGIGAAMIRAASGALKPSGRLFMVANRGLPYEAALSAGFRQSGEIVRDQTYKVLWAKR